MHVYLVLLCECEYMSVYESMYNVHYNEIENKKFSIKMLYVFSAGFENILYMEIILTGLKSESEHASLFRSERIVVWPFPVEI